MIAGGSVGKHSTHRRGLAGRPGPGSPGLDHPDTGRPGPAAPGGRGGNGLAVGFGCAVAVAVAAPGGRGCNGLAVGFGCAIAVAAPARSDSAALGAVGCGITASPRSTCTVTCVSGWMAGPTE